MSLAELQTQMRKALLEEADESWLSASMQEGGIAPEARIGIYQNNVIGSLVAALGDTFSAAKALVGEAFFEHMATAYVRAHPPAKANLNMYGASFATFVAHYEAAASLPYLPDLVRFEYEWTRVFFAEEQQAMALEDWQVYGETMLDKPGVLRPAVSLIACDYPAFALWTFCQRGGEGEPPQLDEGTYYYLIYRSQGAMHCTRLDAAQWAAYSALYAGKTLSEAIEQATQQDQAFDLQGFFAALLHAHLLKKNII